MKGFVKYVVVAGWRFLRTLWLVVGVCVLVLLLGEASYRMLVIHRVDSVLPSVRTKPRVHDPQAATDWYDAYWREFDASSHMHWKPYVYFRRPPITGRYVTIDDLGHRVTNSVPSSGTPVARVFFFGGSTMWGTGQRNEHTIPAEASRRLQGIAGIGGPVDVTNFGEAGYVFTQELLELLLQLRAGNHPDVVVFYDGINDVGAAVQSGVPGIPQNEMKRAAKFAMGRALDYGDGAEGIGKTLRAVGVLGVASLEQLALVRRLERRVPGAPRLISVDSAARNSQCVHRERTHHRVAFAGVQLHADLRLAAHAACHRKTTYTLRGRVDVENPGGPIPASLARSSSSDTGLARFGHECDRGAPFR